MHYDLIIVSNLELDISLLPKINYLWLKTAEVTYNTVNQFTYDYLIIDKIHQNLNLMTEDGKIITNQFLETSMDNVFAIGKINNSEKTINEQLQIIIDYLFMA